MRTKKLLSVLFAVILAIGVFGVIPAGAIDDAAFAAAEAEAAELAAQVAAVGYPASVEIVTDSSLLGRWDANVLVWEVFTRSAPGATDSYDELKRAGTAAVDWKVITYGKTDGAEDLSKEIEMTVYSNEASAALKPFVVFKGSTSTQERLYIKQGSSPYYGTVKVTMTLTATIGGVVQTPRVATKSIVLIDQGAFEEQLKKAQEILDKSDRYRKDYLDGLKKVRDAARFYLSADPTLINFDELVEEVRGALQEAMDASEMNYKIGWDFLDDRLRGSVWQMILKGIWWIVDAVMTVIDFFNAISAIWAPIGNFFSALWKIISAILPIFAGLGALIPLPI